MFERSSTSFFYNGMSSYPCTRLKADLRVRATIIFWGLLYILKVFYDWFFLIVFKAIHRYIRWLSFSINLIGGKNNWAPRRRNEYDSLARSKWASRIKKKERTIDCLGSFECAVIIQLVFLITDNLGVIQIGHKKSISFIQYLFHFVGIHKVLKWLLLRDIPIQTNYSSITMKTV